MRSEEADMEELEAKYDVIIVGARCAGAATAAKLAARGARVLVLEKSSPGKDTLSTHALMRSGVLGLAGLGVIDRLRALGTPWVRTTTFHYGDEPVPIPIRPSRDVEGLLAPRRTVLDAVLVERAKELGATVVHGARVSELVRDRHGAVAGVVARVGARTLRLASGLVVGADGRGSTIADLVQAPVTHRGRHSSGVVYGYWSALELDGYHWYYRPGAGAGVIPTNDGLACVFSNVPGSASAGRDLVSLHHAILRQFPELRRSVDGARLAEPLRRFGGVPGFMRRAAGPGWALVGDAGSFRDPITAHGISDALGQAELLARAVAAGAARELARFREARDALSLPIFQLSDAIASFEWDLATLRELHLELSQRMKQHAEMLHDRGTPVRLARADAARA